MALSVGRDNAGLLLEEKISISRIPASYLLYRGKQPSEMFVPKLLSL